MMDDDRKAGRDGRRRPQGAGLQSLLTVTKSLMQGERRRSSAVIGLSDDDGIIHLVQLDAGMADGLKRPEPEAGPGLRPTLLLVEADEHVRQVTRRILEKRGFTVVAAADAGEALAIGTALAGLSLVIADVATPGLPGPQVARCLQAAHPHMAALFTSAQGDSRVRGDDALRPGQLLLKPYRSRDLFTAIDSAIDHQAG